MPCLILLAMLRLAEPCPALPCHGMPWYAGSCCSVPSFIVPRRLFTVLRIHLAYISHPVTLLPLHPRTPKLLQLADRRDEMRAVRNRAAGYSAGGGRATTPSPPRAIRTPPRARPMRGASQATPHGRSLAVRLLDGGQGGARRDLGAAYEEEKSQMEPQRDLSAEGSGSASEEPAAVGVPASGQGGVPSSFMSRARDSFLEDRRKDLDSFITSVISSIPDGLPDDSIQGNSLKSKGASGVDHEGGVGLRVVPSSDVASQLERSVPVVATNAPLGSKRQNNTQLDYSQLDALLRMEQVPNTITAQSKLRPSGLDSIGRAWAVI